MASYDSDSSDGGEFEETNVLLGYASKEAEEGEETISHLGGYPEWLEAEKPPTAAYARCKVCKDLMVLLLQLNGELPERFPGHERRIYIFGCRRSTCQRKDGTVRVLRGVRIWQDEVTAAAEKNDKEEEETEKLQKEEKKPTSGLGETLFGAKSFGGASAAANPFSSGSANPFSKPSSSAASSNPFSSSSSTKEAPAPKPIAAEKSPAALSETFSKTLALDKTPTEQPPPFEPWPETGAQPKAYPNLYLCDADYETLEPTSTKLPDNARVESADAEEPSALDREAFESTMDAAFQKFADRLSQNPEQVIRYEFAGTPLLYSKVDSVAKKVLGGGIPNCGNCGARRRFEVQMTPHAIAELEQDELSLEGMEWGTVIVAVCEKDCSPRNVEAGEAGYVEEWAGVQWEELVDRQ